MSEEASERNPHAVLVGDPEGDVLKSIEVICLDYGIEVQNFFSLREWTRSRNWHHAAFAVCRMEEDTVARVEEIKEAWPDFPVFITHVSTLQEAFKLVHAGATDIFPENIPLVHFGKVLTALSKGRPARLSSKELLFRKEEDAKKTDKTQSVDWPQEEQEIIPGPPAGQLWENWNPGERASGSPNRMKHSRTLEQLDEMVRPSVSKVSKVYQNENLALLETGNENLEAIIKGIGEIMEFSDPGIRRVQPSGMQQSGADPLLELIPYFEENLEFLIFEDIASFGNAYQDAIAYCLENLGLDSEEDSVKILLTASTEWKTLTGNRRITPKLQEALQAFEKVGAIGQFFASVQE